jgi:hypothetical protein
MFEIIVNQFSICFFKLKFKIGNFGAGRMAQVVEGLSSKHEALSSNPNITYTHSQNVIYNRYFPKFLSLDLLFEQE